MYSSSSVSSLHPKLGEPLAHCNFMVLEPGTFIILSIHSATVLFIQHVLLHNPSWLSLKCRSQMEGYKTNIRKSGAHHSSGGNANNKGKWLKPDHPCLLTLSLNSWTSCSAEVQCESSSVFPLFSLPFKWSHWEYRNKLIQKDSYCVLCLIQLDDGLSPSFITFITSHQLPPLYVIFMATKNVGSI